MGGGREGRGERCEERGGGGAEVKRHRIMPVSAWARLSTEHRYSDTGVGATLQGLHLEHTTFHTQTLGCKFISHVAAPDF